MNRQLDIIKDLDNFVKWQPAFPSKPLIKWDRAWQEYRPRSYVFLRGCSLSRIYKNGELTDSTPLFTGHRYQTQNHPGSSQWAGPHQGIPPAGPQSQPRARRGAVRRSQHSGTHFPLWNLQREGQLRAAAQTGRQALGNPMTTPSVRLIATVLRDENANWEGIKNLSISLQHISSRRHRDGVAGKPNPLLSRHKKRTDFAVRCDTFCVWYIYTALLSPFTFHYFCQCQHYVILSLQYFMMCQQISSGLWDW